MIAARETRGDFSNSEAAGLARRVAERDITGASGSEAVDRVRDARLCARELDDALAKRMRVHDAAGAQAALARVDSGAMSVDDGRGFAGDVDAGWRAVGARSLVRRQDRDARLRALEDPDPLVRREAARAAQEAGDALDLVALAEAARVDPAPMVRTGAVRAIASLSAVAAPAVASVLRDLWESGDDGVREDIALAWAGPALWNAGGRDALHVIVASRHGAAAVEAAAAVLRRHDADAEVTSAAAGQMERAIASGPLRTRLQALSQAPLDRGELRAAVRDAAASDDLEVRVAALARLLASKDAQASDALEALSRPGSPVAERARLALALSGDRRVQAWAEQDLTAARAEVRLAAVTALAAMGRAGRGAPLLADGDPGVRVRAACTLILAARR